MATMPDGKFTKIKKILVGVSGAIMLFASINLSKEGVGFTGDAVWIGIAIAVSLSCAEFMFNSNFEDMNWTILVIGIGAYIYSILTNISGFYSLQGIPGTIFNNFNFKALLGGIFMDVYPEIALAWALKESKVGDLLGNIFKTFANPDNMTEPQRNSSQHSQTTQQSKNQRPPAQSEQDMSRRQMAENRHRTGQPKPQGNNQPSHRDGGYDPSKMGMQEPPNYHPVGMQSNQRPPTLDEFQALDEREYSA